MKQKALFFTGLLTLLVVLICLKLYILLIPLGWVLAGLLLLKLLTIIWKDTNIKPSDVATVMILGPFTIIVFLPEIPKKTKLPKTTNVLKFLAKVFNIKLK